MRSLRPFCVFCVNITMFLKKSLTYQKGITLIELLIAMTLLGIIAAAGTAIDFTSRMALIRGRNRVDVRGKASFAMEHMARHIRFANEVSGGGSSIQMRLDYEDCDIQSVSALNTPSNFTDDYEAKYEYIEEFKGGTKELKYAYIPLGGTWPSWNDMEVIATDVTAVSFTINNDPSNVTILITIKSGVEAVSLETTVSLWCKGNT